jgi:predicted RNA binding protein YcfA (HicA-like mRNA interferase family)
VKQELPALKPKEVLKALERAGFQVKRQTASHVILYRPELKRPLTIPIHTKDLPLGTLRAIIRQANLSVDEFIRLL